MAIADLLAKLVELKSQLVANLSSMGVTANESEKLNTLVPKVLECKSDVIWSQGTVSDEVTSVKIPSGVTSIGSYTFDHYISLASITIPDRVTNIGSSAFFGCTNLTTITIGKGVTSIGVSVFQSCSSLANITIPDGVTSIDSFAFSGCKNLANIYYKGTEEQWNAITKSTDWNVNMGANVEGGTAITYNYTG